MAELKPEELSIDIQFVRRDRFTRAEYEQAAPWEPVGELLGCEASLLWMGQLVALRSGASAGAAIAALETELPPLVSEQAREWFARQIEKAKEQMKDG